MRNKRKATQKSIQRPRRSQLGSSPFKVRISDRIPTEVKEKLECLKSTL